MILKRRDGSKWQNYPPDDVEQVSSHALIIDNDLCRHKNDSPWSHIQQLSFLKLHCIPTTDLTVVLLTVIASV